MCSLRSGSFGLIPEAAIFGMKYLHHGTVMYLPYVQFIAPTLSVTQYGIFFRVVLNYQGFASLLYSISADFARIARALPYIFIGLIFQPAYACNCSNLRSSLKSAIIVVFKRNGY
jgi:hypothetical protein